MVVKKHQKEILDLPDVFCKQNSRLSLVEAEGSCGARFLVRNPDGSEGVLVASDVVLESHKQALGMLGSQEHTAAHLCLGHTW